MTRLSRQNDIAITKTFYQKDTSSAPEDRFTGKPAYIGQQYMISGFPVIVTQIIESPGNQVIILDRTD